MYFSDDYIRAKAIDGIVDLMKNTSSPVDHLKVKETDVLVDDLGFDSIHFVELAMGLGEKFGTVSQGEFLGIELSEDICSGWKTVSDVIDSVKEACGGLIHSEVGFGDFGSSFDDPKRFKHGLNYQPIRKDKKPHHVAGLRHQLALI